MIFIVRSVNSLSLAATFNTIFKMAIKMRTFHIPKTVANVLEKKSQPYISMICDKKSENVKM